MPPLRRARFVLSLLTLWPAATLWLAAPAAHAKPKKEKAAAGKAVKERSGVDPELARFGIVRPENAGMMNQVLARVALDPGAGVVSKNVTHLRPLKKEPGGLALVGGDVAALAVRPGTYSVQVTTPVTDQPPEYLHGHARAWESTPVKVVLSKGEAICLVLEPSITGTEYDGGWTLAKADAPAACASMTQRVIPDDEALPAPPPDAR